MENRFGIKDFFLFALVLLLIVLVATSMIQYDRQWTKVVALETATRDMTRDLVQIRRQLDENSNGGGAGNAAGRTPVDITVHLKVEGGNVSAQVSPSTGGAAIVSPNSNTNTNPNPAPAVQPNATTAIAAAPSQTFTDPFKPIKDAEKRPGFARGDWLVDNFGAKLKAITPYVGNDVPAAWVQAKVQESLMYRDVDTLEFVPLLAKSWTISPDGLTITFQLRKGLTFSDGEPLTADDVVFTFDWIRNPQVNAPRDRSYLDKLVSVKAIDESTVEFKFSEFYFKSLEVVGGTLILPKHFYSKYTPDQFNEAPGLLMGSGPYRLADPAGWKPGMKMELFRNERYWGVQPTFDRLVYLDVEEETAEQTMFTNGEMDIFACTAEQYVKLKDDPKVKARARAMEYNNLLAGYAYVGWNQKKLNATTVFADKRVRQALTMLVDRERIARDVFLGYATVATGPFGMNSKQADPNVKPWPFDPDRARKQLADLGFIDRDGDGILDGPDGKPFKFKLTFPNKSAVYDRITLFMKDGFAKAGIVMERDPVEWPLLQTKLDQRDFDAIMLGWSGSIDDDPHQIFHSGQMSDQGDNRMSYSNPELDKAITDARSCVDADKRLELWHKVHRIIAEDCPYTFMLNRKTTVFFNNRIDNIRPSTIGTNYNKLDVSPLPWFVPADRQRYTK